LNNISNYVQRLLKHKTFKNVGYLVVGNVIGRIIALAGVFYIPKLLGSEQYGIYNTVTAYVALFSVITISGLNKVIIRESAKDLKKAKSILEATIGLRIIFAIIASVVSVIVVQFIDYEIGTRIYVTIFSVSLLLVGMRSSLNTIYQSFEKMKLLAIIAVVRPLFRVPLAILFLINDYGILSLIILDLTIEAFVVLFLYIFSRKLVIFNVFSKINITKKYLVPGIRFSLLDFLNALSLRIDILMLSFLTTPQNVGVYALAYRIVEAGLVLRQPISQSVFPYYSRKFNSSKPRFRDLAIHSAIISIPFLVIILPASFVIEPIIPIVFGNEFLQTAEIFSILVLYLIFHFSLIPWGLFLETTHNESYSIYLCTICAILNITLNIVFFNKYGIIGIAYSTLVVESTRLIMSIILVKKVIR
jgi:O-antigen/teichoic acid export membrane protein